MKKGKIIKRVLCGFLAVILLALLVPAGLILGSSGGRGEVGSEYLIVLGTTVNGTEPSPMLKQRLDAALAYLNEYPDATAIVTGGMGDEINISEALCMYNYLTGAGIAPERVWMEDRARSTIENLRNTMAVLEEHDGSLPEQVTILSSEFHLFRAGLMAKDLGLNAALVPARTEPLGLLAPWFLREIFAVYGYVFSGG